MPFDSIRERTGGAPPIVEPFLDALNRMEEREVLLPEQVVQRVLGVLEEHLGRSSELEETAFAHGPIGLVSEHTHYFGGFALLMPLHYGTAVAVRRADVSSIVFGGTDVRWTFEQSAPEEMPVWVRTAKEVVRQEVPQGEQVEVAVASTVPPFCRQAYLAALAVATARALQGLFGEDVQGSTLHKRLSGILEECTGRPFSQAYSMAARYGQPGTFALVDTAAFEQLLLEGPGTEVLGWGMVDTSAASSVAADVYHQRRQQAGEVLSLLQESGFSGLSSFRGLEHRHLRQATEVLPPPLRPVLRYLVTENRRVQKMVGALRRGDGQLLGALLLMGHASLRDDWQMSHEKADVVVEEVERMSIEGLYGARLVEPGGAVLLTGQPFRVPAGLDHIKTACQHRLETAPKVLFL